MLFRSVHVNHGLRGKEAEADAQFSEEVCRQYGIPCHIYCVDLYAIAKEQQQGLEEAGRNIRYEIFEREAMSVGANLVAVAHHQDDVVETVLFRLIRGTGINGMRGILPITHPFQDNCIGLIRPLLVCTREEIESPLAWFVEYLACESRHRALVG